MGMLVTYNQSWVFDLHNSIFRDLMRPDIFTGKTMCQVHRPLQLRTAQLWTTVDCNRVMLHVETSGGPARYTYFGESLNPFELFFFLSEGWRGSFVFNLRWTNGKGEYKKKTWSKHSREMVMIKIFAWYM